MDDISADLMHTEMTIKPVRDDFTNSWNVLYAVIRRDFMGVFGFPGGVQAFERGCERAERRWRGKRRRGRPGRR